MPRYTVVDVETGFKVREDKSIDPSPFTAGNNLVSIGWTCFDPNDETVYDYGLVHYGFLSHSEKIEGDSPEYVKKCFQEVLSDTDCLIAHNAKFDLTWLLESGFEYDGDIYCTMVGEYLLQCGITSPLGLAALAEKHGLSQKKSDLIEGYLKDGVSFEKIPQKVTREYGMADVKTCMELYHHQQARFQSETMDNVLKLSMEFTKSLTEMERNGICINGEALDEVEKEFSEEKTRVDNELYKIAQEVMGDRPLNLASNDTLSEVLYSRRVRDKSTWKRKFNIGVGRTGKPLPRPSLRPSDFQRAIRELTEVSRRTVAEHCSKCNGAGSFRKTKKDGTEYKRATTCPRCNGTGLFQRPIKRVAGFKLVPRGVQDVSAGGFKSNKSMVEPLLAQARERGNLDAQRFLELMIRSNALSTYLNSFVKGIRKGIRDDGLLHCNFNQTITKTGRLSSSEPNFQNQPRGTTFPIRRVVFSRFGRSGRITEADYSQLEFRVAGMLSGCENVLRDINDGVDVHAFSAKTITEAGQETNRQEAKAHTFKPLYGGQSGTEAEREYYRSFLDRYRGVEKWHRDLVDGVLSGRGVRLPTGRLYLFDGVRRTSSGYVTNSTAIKNYPVQGFATGDIVPYAVNRVYARLKEAGLKSKIILSVHDSIVVDTHKNESEAVLEILRAAMLSDVRAWFASDLKFNSSVPLAIEVKQGKNWLELEEIGAFSEEL